MKKEQFIYIYTLLICLIFTVVLFFYIANMTTAVLDYMNPYYSHAHELSKYETNRLYRKNTSIPKATAESDLTKLREEEKASKIQSISFKAKGDILRGAIGMLAITFILLVHIFILRRTKLRV